MSWLFGITGQYFPSDLEFFKSIHPPPLHLIQSQKMYVAAGGLEETCLSGSLPGAPGQPEAGWLVCGLGIRQCDGRFSLMSQNDWETALADNAFSPRQLNGHFAALRWNGSQVSCFTDQLGIRNLFLAQTGRFTAFSTRLDWIARLRQNCEIDWDQLGGRWLLINQLSTGSILTHTVRLAQGGSAVCTPQSISAKNQPWEPDFALKTKDKDFASVLTELATFPSQTNRGVSLGLSGGLDSRVLLSILLFSKYKNWRVHSFGNPAHPDVQVAKRIAADFRIEHIFPEDPTFKADEYLNLLRAYIGQTMLAAPASAALRLHYYNILHQPGGLVIDGGKGEIARRRYLNRLLIADRDALLEGNPRKIYPYLKIHRGSFFKKEVGEQMQSAAYAQIESLWETMPPIREMEAGNWLDLLAIRTRFPNLSAEQALADEVLVSYMPFAQPSFLQTMLTAPVSRRTNGKMFRSIIQKNCRRLTRYPLVKEGTLYPYPFTTIPASLWTGMKRQLGYTFRDNTAQNFLDTLEEFIRDTVHSNEIKQVEFYDYPAILEMVSEYYRGNKRYTNELDWWLAFEIWRQTIFQNRLRGEAASE